MVEQTNALSELERQMAVAIKQFSGEDPEALGDDHEKVGD